MLKFSSQYITIMFKEHKQDQTHSHPFQVVKQEYKRGNIPWMGWKQEEKVKIDEDYSTKDRTRSSRKRKWQRVVTVVAWPVIVWPETVKSERGTVKSGRKR
ncbi:uncharacterized protein G2W53_004154 [Senna tora]|uniref:Uncharacterized protein n=1 Tax=Senna tora TaxID=362788 RepID=A0A835CGB7_9FABA|nr:uncharacterized protein G2W53_004154 [Senna tora]